MQQTFWFHTSTTTSLSCGCPSFSSSPASSSSTLCSWEIARFSYPSKSTRQFAIIHFLRRWTGISHSRGRCHIYWRAHRGGLIGRRGKRVIGRGKGSRMVINMNLKSFMEALKVIKIRIRRGRRHFKGCWSLKAQIRN